MGCVTGVFSHVLFFLLLTFTCLHWRKTSAQWHKTQLSTFLPSWPLMSHSHGVVQIRCFNCVHLFVFQTWRPLREDWQNMSLVCNLQREGGEVSSGADEVITGLCHQQYWNLLYNDLMNDLTNLVPCCWSACHSPVLAAVILIVVSVCTATGAWNWLIDPDTQKVSISGQTCRCVPCFGLYGQLSQRGHTCIHSVLIIDHYNVSNVSIANSCKDKAYPSLTGNTAMRQYITSSVDNCFTAINIDSADSGMKYYKSEYEGLQLWTMSHQSQSRCPLSFFTLHVI